MESVFQEQEATIATSASRDVKNRIINTTQEYGLGRSGPIPPVISGLIVLRY